MSKRGEVLGGIALSLLLITGCSKKVEPEETGFLALDRESRNVANYDASWRHIEANHFDAKAFTTEEWVARRAEWRQKAAASEPALLYINVLDNFALQFPQSHVAFERPASKRQETADEAPTNPTSQMLDLMFAGPGFLAPVTRRDPGRWQTIADVVRGSPAERAGVAPGWILWEYKSQMTPDRAWYSAVFLKLSAEHVHAMEQTGQVPLKNMQPGVDPMSVIESMKVRLEFDLEPFSTPGEFELRKLSEGVTYLRFDRFESMELVNQVIDGIGSGANGGLILDLRRNVGGRFIHMSRIAGALLGGNVLLGTQRDSDSEIPTKTLRLTPHFEGPLAVLIGPATSSAAEITAAAVQDHKRGKLFGRFTNGSVVAARKFDLPDGGTVMLPVSDFVRVDGRRIEGSGVEPDIWILPTLEDVRAGRDPVLERALLELAATPATAMR